jgi:hypothetical protein
MEAYRGRKGRPPLINLDNEWMWLFNQGPVCFIPETKETLNGRLGEPQRGLNVLGKKKYRVPNGIQTPDRQARTLFTVLTDPATISS